MTIENNKNNVLFTMKIFFILFLFLLTGCSTTKEKYERDLPSLPSDWSSSYQSLKEIDGWAETFNDEELLKLISEALENNKDLKIASSRLDIARASSRARSWARVRTISRANNRKKVDSRKDKREIENESLIDETTVVSDIENKEKEDISDEKVSTPNKKLTVKELLEQRKQKNSNKRKVKD